VRVSDALPHGAEAFAQPLWRALAVFRMTALAYASLLAVRYFREYDHPLAAWPVLAGLGAWTAYTVIAYNRPAARRWPLLAADFAIALGFLVATRWVVGPEPLKAGVPTLTVAWLAAPVLAWAVAGGRRLGATAAIALGSAEMVVRGKFNQPAVTAPILMLLAAVAVGHVARLAGRAEERLHRAVELEAATRERERLARGIHDSVLQVLALVQRRGTELGGDAAELGRLAGEQEVALRALVSGAPPVAGTGPVDLRAALARYASGSVTLATPATPVTVDRRFADEVTAAVGSALDNVRHHAGTGARAWVLVEDDAGTLTVSVRDDGAGFGPDRLAEAAAAGRLGVAQSILGRVRDLGGTVTITSTPGHGTEVEMRLRHPDHTASR
jgi:signal transduction histidine kinase